MQLKPKDGYFDGKPTISKSTLPMLTKIEVLKGLINDLLYERIDGFTINKNLHQPKQGFMVGGVSEVYYCLPTDDEIKALLIKSDGKFYVGGWVEDGTVCIELSELYESRKQSLMIAKKRDEKAVYDLEAKEVIYI